MHISENYTAPKIKHKFAPSTEQKRRWGAMVGGGGSGTLEVGFNLGEVVEVVEVEDGG